MEVPNALLRAFICKKFYHVSVPQMTLVSLAVCFKELRAPAAYVLGAGALTFLALSSLYVPAYLLRPRPYEDMPKSVLGCMVAVPVVVLLAIGMHVIQNAIWPNYDPFVFGARVLWAADVIASVCLGWCLFKDRSSI